MKNAGSEALFKIVEQSPLTQSKFGQLICSSQQSISGWKLGHSVPGYKFRVILEEKFGIPQDAWDQSVGAVQETISLEGTQRWPEEGLSFDSEVDELRKSNLNLRGRLAELLRTENARLETEIAAIE